MDALQQQAPAAISATTESGRCRRGSTAMTEAKPAFEVRWQLSVTSGPAEGSAALACAVSLLPSPVHCGGSANLG
eukprot:351163-Chlamydomonas_euryale.AAC.2